jgi:hypothetical protein
MKLPRHLMPKALCRALRKEKVDRVLGRPRLTVWKPWEQLLPKPPEPLSGTREERWWELVVRACKRERRLTDGPERALVSRVLDSLHLRQWVVWWFRLNPALSSYPDSGKTDAPAVGATQESPAIAPTFTPDPSEATAGVAPSERAADYVAGQSESLRKQLLKQWAVGIAWIAAVVVAIVWLVRMNTLPLAVFWFACPAAAWLLTVRPVAACFTIRGRGILAIILIVLSIFASLAMNARRREVTDWLGNASLEGYTTLTEETDEQDDDDPRFSKGPRTGWTAKSGAGTFALTLFEMALFASIFAVPLVTGWLTRDARNKMDQEYWRTEHEKARGLTADVQKP